ncbi:MAG: hypothetical protein HW380_3213 [Magnetococcales bacterium]|nr:hypothetical protein [Magnetococcales bacterium]
MNRVRNRHVQDIFFACESIDFGHYVGDDGQKLSGYLVVQEFIRAVHSIGSSGRIILSGRVYTMIKMRHHGRRYDGINITIHLDLYLEPST